MSSNMIGAEVTCVCVAGQCRCTRVPCVVPQVGSSLLLLRLQHVLSAGDIQRLCIAQLRPVR